MILHELEEFGKRVGIEDIDLSDETVFSFEIEDIGTLSIEKNDTSEEVFVYLSFSVPQYENEFSKKVLELCNYKNAHKFTLYGGIYSNTAIFFTKIPFEETKASTIENITHFFIEIKQNILQ